MYLDGEEVQSNVHLCENDHQTHPGQSPDKTHAGHAGRKVLMHELIHVPKQCTQYICKSGVHINIGTENMIPYSGKFSWDKIFTDGPKNENSLIRFLRMLAYRAEQKHNYA